MAGKARVHELAKELNVTSKDILLHLSELGEFVKSASSTVEAPVARRLRDKFSIPTGGTKSSGSASGSEQKNPSAVRDQRHNRFSPETRVAGTPANNSPILRPQQNPIPSSKPSGSYGDTHSRPAAPGPRPMPKPQRVANNPYSTGSTNKPGNGGRNQTSGQGGQRSGEKAPRPQAPGGHGSGGVGNTQGNHRPHNRPGSNTSGSGHPQRGGGASGNIPRPGAHNGSRGNGTASPSSSGQPRPGGQRKSSFSQGMSFPSTQTPASLAPTTGPNNASARGGRSGRSGHSGAGGAFGRQGNNLSGSKKRKSKKQKKSEFDMMEAPELGGIRLPRGDGQTIRLARGASLSDFAEKIHANPASLVQALFKLGEMVTTTQSVSEDTLQLLGAELNFTVQVVSPEDEDRELLENFDLSFGEDEGDSSDLERRAPVVAVMGHVDHGKTRLLDTIRKTNVRDSEAGGITQHIGAYRVIVPFEGDERPVTFIDTPGHEAFTAMRARGAKVTDIAILVVAADDGVMPQTIEAINHAQAANVPIVVAVNKIDKEGANPDKIRAQLTEFNLIAEEYGGQTMFIDISAMHGTNIDRLLEAILLTADAELDLKANPNMDAQGVAIEAHLDRGRGPVATVLIQRGTLRVGDSIVAGDAYGRVRRMTDEHGADVEEAEPSRPVQVVGFTSVPGAGDNLLVVEEDRIARQIADRRNARKRNALHAKKRISLEDLDSVLKEISQLNLILKGDNSGTVEALEEALLGIEIDDEVQLRVIDRGVGGVTETNVNLAAASDAIIIAFNVRNEGKASELAVREGVEIRYYTIIYQVIEEIEKALKGMLKPIYEEKEIGKAEIREIFKSSKIGAIAGCLVIEGHVKRNAKARLVRNSSVIQDIMTISSLRREKDDVTEVRDGYECGIVLTYSDFKIGDIIESYELVEVERV